MELCHSFWFNHSFILPHSPRPVFLVSSSLFCSPRSRESNSGLPYSKPNALPTEPRRTLIFRELQFLFHLLFYVWVRYSVVRRGPPEANGVLEFKMWLIWCFRPKTSILDKSLSRGKQEVSLSAFALLFSETVQYCQVIVVSDCLMYRSVLVWYCDIVS